MRFLKPCFAFLSLFSVVSAQKIDDDLFYEDDFLSYQQPSQNKTQTQAKTPQPQVKKTLTHNHFYIQGEALILNSGLNSLEFGDRVIFTNGVEEHYLSCLPRPYSLGVRGTVGADLNAMGWGIKAQGLHFSNSQKRTLNASESEAYLLYLTYSSNLNNYKPQILPGGRQKGAFNVDLNIGDLLMDVSLMKKKHFEFICDTGLRYVHLHQRFNVTNYNINVIFEDLTGPNQILNSDKFSAFGMLLRIHNKFYFTKQFSLDLQGAVSCVYGQEKMYNSAIGDPLYDPEHNHGSSFLQYSKKVMPIVEFEAKFAFEQSLFDDSFLFEISAGYMLMDFINGFNGIKIGYTDLESNDVESTVRFSADTVFQGMTAGIGFRF